MLKSDNAPAPAAPRSQRVEPIQWLRGVAAMLVVCNHAGLLALKHLGTPDDASHLVEWNLAKAGAFGVDIFFVISGFVMAMSAQRFDGALGAADFLAQRYNRIAPLFYLMSAVLFADILRAQVAFDVREVANTLTFIPWVDGREYHWPIHYLGWTLAFEFVFYGVVGALIWAGPRRRLLVLALILLALPALGAMFDWPWMPLRMLTSPMMIEFAFGVVLYRAWLAGWFDGTRLRWHLLLVLGLLFYGWPVFSDPDVVQVLVTSQFEFEGAAARVLWWGVPAMAIVCWTLTLPVGEDRWPRRVARAIGDASYSIYLTHLFVVRLAEEVIERTGTPVVLAAASVLIISPIVGLISYRLLEQPLLRIGQGWVARLRARFGRAARTSTDARSA
jgi:exopolysaccharide production protein ExoZ